MTSLFQSAKLGKLTLENRIMVAPMCQYSGSGGVITPWHHQHIGRLACSGAAALTMEATAVEPAGRISKGCLGLWNDEQEEHLTHLLQEIRSYAGARIGIQLNHAGRKASAAPPWDGGKPVSSSAGGWSTTGPSPIPWGKGWPTPQMMNPEDMDRIQSAFINAAIRAERSGFDFIEIHAAHGYLLHSFLSPLSNCRKDEYGGSLSNRMKFPLRIISAVRNALHPKTTVGVRMNGTDWDDQGWSSIEAGLFAEQIEHAGVDYISVSSGGARSGISYPQEPGYQVFLSEEIRSSVKVPIICAGLINEPHHANEIIQTGKADIIALGRTFLNDPNWPLRAAKSLGHKPLQPNPYMSIASPHWLYF